MTFWVHIERDGKLWRDASHYDPPAPKPVPGKGFALYFVEFDSALLQFSSLAELQVCIEALSQRALPSNLRLTQKRLGGVYGLSHHWLNRIPLRSMAWSYRQKVVKYLQVSLADFETQVKLPAS